jgi:hypothetical protein
MYADYTFYGSSYGGSLLSSAEFTALEPRAELHIDCITFMRLHTDNWAVTDAVKMAVCAVADTIKRHEAAERAAETAAGLKSENNDGYAVTYQDPTAAHSALSAAMTDAARPYLVYTGLMDRSAR